MRYKKAEVQEARHGLMNEVDSNKVINRPEDEVNT